MAASQKGAKEQTVDFLSERIGVLAEIIVDDLISEMGIQDAELNVPHTYQRFLNRLKTELPNDCNPAAVAAELMNLVLINPGNK